MMNTVSLFNLNVELVRLIKQVMYAIDCRDEMRRYLYKQYLRCIQHNDLHYYTTILDFGRHYQNNIDLFALSTHILYKCHMPPDIMYKC